MNGGMQRCFHLLHQLSRYFKVTAIIHQDLESFEKARSEYPSLNNVEVISTENYKDFTDVYSLLPARMRNALRFRWYSRSVSEKTDSSFLLYFPLLRKLLFKRKYDVVLLENLNTLNAAKLIRRLSPGTKILFDAHNVDSELAAETMQGHQNESMVNRIRERESSLYKYADAFIACSNKDKDTLLKMNDQKIRGGVVPNGVTIHNGFPIKDDKSCSLIFCGSLHYPPNAEAMLWFYHDIWPLLVKQLPQLTLTIITDQVLPPQLENLTDDKSIYISGQVPDVKTFYNKATVAIVPLKSGSGTRLKILEAMSLGVPVVSTSKGAEGLDYTNDRHLIVSDDARGFSEQLISLLNNKTKQAEIIGQALLLVNHKYNWDAIGASLQGFINNLKTSSTVD